MIRNLLILFLIIANFGVFAQCPVADFDLSVSCGGAPVVITNNSLNSDSFEWDFCSGEVAVSNLVQLGAANGVNVFSNSNYLRAFATSNGLYLFSTKPSTNQLLRASYGLNFENLNPVVSASNSSNNLYNGITAFDIIRESDKYYGIGVNQTTNRVVRMNLDSLNYNSFVADTLKIFPFVSARDLQIYKDSSQYVALIANGGSPSITMVNFGNSILNNPSINDTLNITGFPNAVGISSFYLVKECNNWVGIVVSSSTNAARVYRVNFGPVLFDQNYSIQPLVNQTFSLINNLQIINEDGIWKVFLFQASGAVSQVNIGSSLLASPSIVGSFSLVNSLKGGFIINNQSKWYLYENRTGATQFLTTYKFNQICNSPIEFSTLQSPPSIQFGNNYNQKVVLKTFNNGVLNSLKKSVDFKVKPTSSFVNSPLCETSMVTFNSTSTSDSGQIISSKWSVTPFLSNFNSDSIQLQFPDTGYYEVQLISENNYGCLDTLFDSIYINKRPSAAFSFTPHCEGDTIDFQNNSSFPVNPFLASNWLFPLGSSSNSYNSEFVFPDGGNYSVQLIITDSFLCKDTSTQQVLSLYKPDIDFGYTNDCSGQTTLFDNNSFVNGSTIDSFYWEFGDGNTSSLIDPSNLYSSSGNYNLTLFALATNGCYDTLTDIVSIVSPPQVDFSFPSICQSNPFTFSSNIVSSDSVVSVKWYFGNGDSSSFLNPTYQYSNPGSYDVTLVAFTGNTCSSFLTKSVLVKPAPVPNFIFDTLCAGSSVNFLNTSTAVNQAINYTYWDFNGFDTIYSFSTSYAFDTGGNYNVTLYVQTDSGCFANIQKTIPVYYNPVASFSSDGNCFDNQVQFTNTSQVHFTDVITSCSWSFGDGASSALCNPIHNFVNANSYSTMLVVLTNKGCRDTVINFSGPPFANFTSSSAVCEGTPFNVLNQSSGLENQEWDFCSGELGTSNIQFTGMVSNNLYSSSYGLKVINDGAGWYYFALNRNSNSLIRGTSGNSLENSISGVTNLGSFGNLLVNPRHIDIYKEGSRYIALIINESDTSKSLIRLDFGNSLISTPIVTNLGGLGLKNPRNIKMVKEGNNYLAVVSNSSDNSISVISFGNSFMSTPLLSDVNNIQLPVQGTLYGFDIYSHCCNWYGLVTCNQANATRIYAVDFQSILNDNSISQPVIVFAQANVSQQTNNLYDVKISLEGGEAKALAVWVQNTTTRLAYLNFGSNFANFFTPVVNPVNGLGGISNATQIVNSGSKWYAINPVYAPSSQIGIYRVSFRDSCDAGNLSIQLTNQPQSVVYSYPGNYRVSLNGSSGSCVSKQVFNNVQILPAPSVNFQSISNCINTSTSFINNTTLYGSAQNINYIWSFGDNSLSQLFAPQHTYSSIDTYQVKLVATTSVGCSDSIIKPVFISELPVASFNVSSNCERDTLPVVNTSTYVFDSIVSYDWNLATIYHSQLQTPKFFPEVSGLQPIRLIVTNSNGCSDTSETQILIKSKPNISFTSVNSCLGQPVTFHPQVVFDDNSTIVNQLWDFGDGNTSTSLAATNVYPPVINNYFPKLIVSASNGCIDSIQSLLHIATPPIADFDFELPCNANQTLFTSLSTGTSDPVYKQIWEYNGMVDSSVSPLIYFDTPGSYTVMLRAVSQSWCEDTIVKIVNVLQSPLVQVNSDTVCLHETALFTGTASINPPFTINEFFYTFGDGDTTTGALSTNHIYESSGLYQVIFHAISDTGCVGTDTAIAQVRSLPQTEFYTDVSCAFAPTVFTNVSTIPQPEAIADFLWDFGDNTSSVSFNPLHSYQQQGIYSVQLIATSTNGCVDTISKIVEVFAPLVADFTISSKCLGDTIVFNDASNSFSVTSHVWSAGNNLPFVFSDSLKYFYTQPGIYEVYLEVENILGCKDSIVKSVEIFKKPEADFSPLSICLGQTFNLLDETNYFQDSNYQTVWNINNDITFQPTPQLTFSFVGSYPIKLNVLSLNGCRDSVEKVLVVHENPASQFAMTPPFGQSPIQINFTNNSLGAESYLWSFGDGNTSLDEEPSHIYSSDDTFTVSLEVQNIHGCTSVSSQSLFLFDSDLDLMLTDLEVQLEKSSTLTSAKLSVKLVNLGSRIIDQAHLIATLGNGGSLSEEWTGLLLPGQSVEYVFNSTFVYFDETRETFICIQANEVNNGQEEINISNNEACSLLKDRIQFYGPYPNPADQKSVLSAIVDEPGQLELKIHDGIGAIVYLTSTSIQKGRNYIELPVSVLRRGIYIIQVRYLDDVYYHKLEIK